MGADGGKSLGTGRYDLQAKYEDGASRVFLSGTQAMVRVVFEQMRIDRSRSWNTAAFVSGYPGSPLGGFDQELARQRRLLDELHVVHVPGHNEELAATAVWGSQVASTFEERTYDAVLGVWYAKGPGLDRAADAIRHAQYVGTSARGGVLALVGNDPGGKSSSIPNTSEQTLLDFGVPTLVPGNVADIIELGLHGIAMSRASGLWSALRINATVADGTGTFDPAVHDYSTKLPLVEWRGKPYVPRVLPIPGFPYSVEVEAELFGPRQQIAREYGYLNQLNSTTVAPARPWLGIMAVGYLHGELLTALGSLGLEPKDLEDLGIRICRVRMIQPLDRRTIVEFASGLSEILVVEEKRSFVESMLKETLYGRSDAPLVVGKMDELGAPLLPVSGSIDANSLLQPLYDRLSRTISAERLRAPRARHQQITLIDAARTPYFCSGCPHNSSTKVPAGALVGSGIGCHAMIKQMDPSLSGIVTTSTHMGGEGAPWIGISPFVNVDHMFQNMGDGTYFHSGQLAVQAAVAAGAHITYKLLFNDAIAMTGGQSPAESDAVPVSDVAEILLRQGVTKVLITTDDVAKYRHVKLPSGVRAWDRTRIVEAQEELRRSPGVTVLIHDQRCAAENRRDRKRGRLAEPDTKVMINERVCEGCGDCGVKSNCLSVEPVDTFYGRKTRINQATCNLDYSCLNGDCPSFMTIRTRNGSAKPSKTKGRSSGVEAIQMIPEPSIPEDEVFRIRMPGIGGTGVVSASQILGTAALTDGRICVGLDQTGLSQKAGPVVSDLQISTHAVEGSSRSSQESVDLLLGFDLLVASSADTLECLIPGRSRAVISLARVPTGAMISNDRVSYPDTEEFQRGVEEVLGADRVWWVDPNDATESVLGGSAEANIFLLGVAYQIGSLPLRRTSIEEAIRLNGVAVERNLAVFQSGRRWVFDGHVRGSSSPNVSPAGEGHRYVPEGWMPEDAATAVERLAADLEAYQNRRYAQRFVERILTVARAERRARPDSYELITAFASGLHKLMAYKDEYEVARLSLDVSAAEGVRAEFGPGARVYWNLHPPLLRERGLKRKLRLGPWFRPVFVVMYKARGLRGTKLDPFGRHEMRRLERQLLVDFEEVVDAVSAGLSAENFDVAVAIATLPLDIRGYEELKLRRANEYKMKLATLLDDFFQSGFQPKSQIKSAP